MFKTQYYKNHIFLAFSRQKSLLPWQPTKIWSGSSSYFDEYLKDYLCAKFGAFAKKLTIFSQIRWTIRRKWKEKGMMVVSDLLDYLTVPLTLEKFQVKFGIKINFLDHGMLGATFKKTFWMERNPRTQRTSPQKLLSQHFSCSRLQRSIRSL